MKEGRPITQYPQPTEREHNPPTTEQVLSCVRNVGVPVLDRMISAQLAIQRAQNYLLNPVADAIAATDMQKVDSPVSQVESPSRPLALDSSMSRTLG